MKKYFSLIMIMLSVSCLFLTACFKALAYIQNRLFTPILHGFSQPDAGAGAV